MAAAPVVPLTIPQQIALYRQKFPDGLVCNGCGLLLATLRASSSRLTDAERLEYVCAECRADAAKAAQASAARKAAGAANLAAAREARMGMQAALRTADLVPTESVTSKAVDMTVHRGGRPQKHASRKHAARAASRAYRARIRQAAMVA